MPYAKLLCAVILLSPVVDSAECVHNGTVTHCPQSLSQKLITSAQALPRSPSTPRPPPSALLTWNTRPPVGSHCERDFVLRPHPTPPPSRKGCPPGLKMGLECCAKSGPGVRVCLLGLTPGVRVWLVGISPWERVWTVGCTVGARLFCAACRS